MEEKILSKVESLSENLINDILEIIKIPSVKSQSQDDAPFGREIRNALDKSLEISERLGFVTKNIQNKIGYAQYSEGDDYVGVIGHLDVVDVGEGWRNPPFSGHVEDGYIYNRGVLDNKGPIFSCLYGMYALKELGIKTKYPIRIIFGCDEETGRFEDLKCYLENEKPPIMGFTPDCKYPVVYSERGRAILTLQAPVNNVKEFFDFINIYFLNARSNGEKLGINFEDKEFGILEMKNYKLENTETHLKFILTVSYPFGITCYEILKKANEKIEKFQNLKIFLKNQFLPVKFSKDDFMIQCLKYSYEKVTGLDGTPVTTSGGTYAKMMPNIVPFGPSFPGQKNISHNPNEWMKIDEIILNAKIYALSLYKLTQKNL